MSLDAAFDLGVFSQKNNIPDQAEFKGFCLELGSRGKFLKALPVLFSPVTLSCESAEAYCFATISDAIDTAGQVGHNSFISVLFNINGLAISYRLMDCSLIPYDFINSYFEAKSVSDWERIQRVCFSFGVGWIAESLSNGVGSFELRNDLYIEGQINYLHCIECRLVQVACDDDSPCVFGFNKLKFNELEQYLQLNALPGLNVPL